MPPQALPDNELEDALLIAFTREGLLRMVRRRLGLILEREIDVNRGTKFIVSDLVSLAVREGWRDDLVRGALRENEGNPVLLRVARHLGVAPSPAAPDTLAGPTLAPTPNAAAGAVGGAGGEMPLPAMPTSGSLDHGRLEKFVRDRGVFLKWQEFTRKLVALGYQLCRIEIAGDARGTGWLVDSALVLTNYHVIEEVKKQLAAPRDILCRFDYFVDEGLGLPCGLAAEWLADSSPYAESDKRADAAEPTEDQLDYALLRLERPMGSEVVAHLGVARGWLHVSAAPPMVLAEDIVMVPQFPNGRSLELAYGAVIGFNQSGTRLRHNANTDEGSSGSPVLTPSLEPCALHHAGGPGRALRYNQCVPLRSIINRIGSNPAITPFWQV